MTTVRQSHSVAALAVAAVVLAVAAPTAGQVSNRQATDGAAAGPASAIAESGGLALDLNEPGERTVAQTRPGQGVLSAEAKVGRARLASETLELCNDGLNSRPPEENLHRAAFFRGSGGIVVSPVDGESINLTIEGGGRTHVETQYARYDGLVVSLLNSPLCSDECRVSVRNARNGGWYWVNGDRNAAVAPFVCDERLSADVLAPDPGGVDTTRSSFGGGSLFVHHTQGLMGIVPHLADSTNEHASQSGVDSCGVRLAPYFRGSGGFVARPASGRSLELTVERKSGEATTTTLFPRSDGLVVQLLTSPHCVDESGSPVECRVSVAGAEAGSWYWVNGDRNAAVAPFVCEAQLGRIQTALRLAPDPGGVDTARSLFGGGSLFLHHTQGLMGIVPHLVYEDEYRVGFDLDWTGRDPTGITFMPRYGLLFVVGPCGGSARAYTTTGVRRPEKDFQLAPVCPEGITYVDSWAYGSEPDGAFMVVRGSGLQRRVNVYDAATGSRLYDRDFLLPEDNRYPSGIGFGEWRNRNVTATRIITLNSGRTAFRAEDPWQSFELRHSDNNNAQGVTYIEFSGDQPSWLVVDGGGTQGRAFRYLGHTPSSTTGVSRGRKVDLHWENDDPTGVAVDARRFYVVDREDKFVYAYSVLVLD